MLFLRDWEPGWSALVGGLPPFSRDCGDSGMAGNAPRSLPPNESCFEGVEGVEEACGGAPAPAPEESPASGPGPAGWSEAFALALASPLSASAAAAGPVSSTTNSHAASTSAFRSAPSPTTLASCAATPATKLSLCCSRGFFCPPSALRPPPTLRAPPARSASAALAAAAAKPEGPRPPNPPSLSAPACASSLRIAPRMGTPRRAVLGEGPASVARKLSSCARLFVLLRTTPATASSSSRAREPLSTAAADRAECAAQSRTSRTGAPRVLATCAALPRSSPSGPSNSVSPPSTTAMSAESATRATRVRLYSRESIQPSRVYDGRPVAASCRSGSRGSGPTLNACTRRPRWRSAAISPTATVVFPDPACVPATTMTFIAPRRRARARRSNQNRTTPNATRDVPATPVASPGGARLRADATETRACHAVAPSPA